ncbi:uncharacterized protein Z518_01933 [Rhinocladiella mackenziei CBS 650.93]|uniref:Rhinocladiella mackenziei CBS 650.93 unplaced genomic scaffold supercont1.2, whole genome shotgun sequence n=1 Tax=Rhinocladiella mackenziei CBS 650.93 TaxID=1442369 RepID=A0A0D2JDL4_9EURO|nr:uncharacterized protein Z518_01933 [Rhinocladiella mackenziei CBS 650.93]KIX07280.1 hypothetical protein Z518_01933 [Rhinocladiella mackenziei CBS 650.93]
METSLSTQPCWLLNLPDELKLQVVNYIDKRRDLYNLSRTSRIFEGMVMIRLYHNVDFEMSQSRPSRKPGMPAFREPVTQSVRELTIRNGVADRRNSVHNRRRKSDASSADGYVIEILEQVPANQLTSFAFLHRTAMTRKMLDLLTQRHDTTLRHLRFYEIAARQEDHLFPTNLASLECRTVNEGDGVEKILSANKKSLQRLRLGQEKHLMEHYHRTRVGFLEQIPQPMETFFASVFALENFLHLRELSLYGLDVTMLRPASVSQALFLCNLERLTLESCPGSAELLESVAGTFHWASHSPEAPQNPRILPSLKHFLFRHESPTNALKDAIIRFLTSFTGLRTLSLLFENAAFLERSSTFIAEHGPTLQTLVLESRIQPREHLSMDTSRPFGVGGYSQELWAETINDTARLCPRLEELGMGFPWNDETVRLRKTALPTLQHLRTIHIRNFPENHVFSQLGDYSIKEYATKFIEWVFPTLVGGNRPSLEHLAIGPTLYESRWKISPSTTSSGATVPRRQPPEFLRTHHFCLDWAKTRFGRWSPLITSVSEKFMEEMAEEKPLGGVFEQVWLR